MKVFVTGATGFVGSAVVDELIAAGHKVLGLSRNLEKGEALGRQGAEVLHGQLEDHVLLVEAAASCDATIHCGFSHDFTRFAESCANEGKLVAALGKAYYGTKKPILLTSGVGMMRDTVTEIMAVQTDGANPRKITEMMAEELIAQGVDVRIIRLPIVHGDNDHGFLALLINIAKEKGFVGYAGEGINNWPGVHRLDAARVYRLALDKGTFGSRYHPVAEEGIAYRDVATVMAARLGQKVRGLQGDEIVAYFTWFSAFAQMDRRASSAITQKALGWIPSEIGMIEDLRTSSSYF
ncbi:MAG: SDR family oxidoreductase [Aestuariivirga sp.]